MKRKTIKSIQDQKNIKKISCLTAYTSSIAKIIDKHVDVILIGDSVGTAIYGMDNTQNVNLEMMIRHGRAVIDSSKKAFTIVDMPYNTYRNKREALRNAKRILSYTNCQSVKLETDHKTLEIVNYLTKNNIRVVSHIGVTPQKYKNFNKIRSTGKSIEEKKLISDLAIRLQKAGSIMIVLECMKEDLARKITHMLKIPTIGIGASSACDGQILVINDIIGSDNSIRKPKFVKSYSNIEKNINNAVKKFTEDVVKKKFPKIKNTY